MNIKPFIELMRLDRREGIYLILWPCLWSIAIASHGKFQLDVYLLFILAAVIMRSAGCVANDIVDRKLDAGVERTKNRPLPSGRVTVRHALFLLAGLLASGAVILLYFNMVTVILGLVIIVPIFLYPFMKRITYWPQAFLAVTFNWGALMGAAAVKGEVTFSSIMLYAACCFWTLGYDTIYAHQDKEYDAVMGIKSTALKFGKNTKKYLAAFYTLVVLFLWMAGVSADLGIIYHICMIIAAMFLAWQVSEVKLDNPQDCLQKFRSNVYFGLVIFLGILGGGWR